EAEGGLAAEAQRAAQLLDQGRGDAVLVPGDDLGIGPPSGEGGEGDIAFGSPAGEELGGEEAAERAQALLAGSEEAEAVQGMAHVRRAPAEGEDGHGGVGDLLEEAAGAGRGLVQETGRHVGRNGEDDLLRRYRAGRGLRTKARGRADD